MHVPNALLPLRGHLSVNWEQRMADTTMYVWRVLISRHTYCTIHTDSESSLVHNSTVKHEISQRLFEFDVSLIDR